MARPIQPTPILKGKDAETFLEDLKKAKPSPVVHKHLEDCQRLYEAFIAKSTHKNGNNSL